MFDAVHHRRADAAELRELDEVAYLRFASVYRAFGSTADFECEIQMLRTEGEVTD